MQLAVMKARGWIYSIILYKTLANPHETSLFMFNRVLYGSKYGSKVEVLGGLFGLFVIL